jgi:assimilatory nitrate reductase catalytic subunit
MNPEDGKRLGLRQRSKVRVLSRRGELCARALLTASVARGQVFLPMHDAATNRLTLPVVDPYSRQPGYKYCAVRVEKIAR